MSAYTGRKPTRTDICAAIRQGATYDWIDPPETPIDWLCEVYDPDGKRVGDASGHTAGAAMALSWLRAWATNAYVDYDTVPLDVPAGWRFELTPPQQAA